MQFTANAQVAPRLSCRASTKYLESKQALRCRPSCHLSTIMPTCHTADLKQRCVIKRTHLHVSKWHTKCRKVQNASGLSDLGVRLTFRELRAKKKMPRPKPGAWQGRFPSSAIVGRRPIYFLSSLAHVTPSSPIRSMWQKEKKGDTLALPLGYSVHGVPHGWHAQIGDSKFFRVRFRKRQAVTETVEVERQVVCRTPSH